MKSATALMLAGLAVVTGAAHASFGAVELLKWDIYKSSEFLAAGASVTSLDGSWATVSSTSNANHILASQITRGAGWAAASAPTAWEGLGNGLFTTRTSWNRSSLEQAVAYNEYFQITITPESGYAMNLSSLNLSLYEQSNVASTVVVQYSTDGFASSVVTLPAVTSITSGWTVPLSTWTLADQSALQNVTSTVTFRVFGYGFTNSDHGLGRGGGSNTDANILGDVVAVPEAASLGILALGLLGLYRRSARMRSA